MRAPPAIPDHTLLRLIGQGAYGEVWLARNVMGTFRAVKIIWRRQFDSARPFERELGGIQRYEPVSRASGGLVHVLHVGKNDAEGYFYYVMELADDANQPISEPETPDSYRPRTLRSDLKKMGRLPTADCLRLAIEVAGGLAQLHRHGLVHRDVKPGNIIFVNHCGKLADIGLVTAEGEGRTFVGTEGYIPPEGPGTPAADLYALGVVLYEASTGFSPDRLPDMPAEWLAESAGDEALELHEVILKASEGQRERRYEDVESLQADLALLQSGQSVRRVRALERRNARLRRAGLAATVLVVFALVAAFLASYRARLAAESSARETVLRQRAQEAQARAEKAERQASQQLYSALVEQARATVHSGELGQRVRALDAIQRAAAISNSDELRGAAIAAMALPDLRLERAIEVKEPLATLDPAFARVALLPEKGAVEIRNVADGHLLATLPAAAPLAARHGAWSSDGHFLAVTRAQPYWDYHVNVEVWDVARSKRVLWIQDVEFGELAFHPRLSRIILGKRDGNAGVWDIDKDAAKETANFKFPATPQRLRYSPDGGQFAACYEKDGAAGICVCDATNGAPLWSQALPAPAAGLDWEPGGRWIALSDYGGNVRLLDAKNGTLRTLGSHKGQASLVAFSPGGDYLMSGGWEREIICWDLARMERAFNIPLNSFRAQFSQNGRQCAVFGDGKLGFYQFERPDNRVDLADDLGPRIRYASFSQDSRWLAVSAQVGVGIWDLEQAGPARIAAIGPDARVFFSTAERRVELFACTDDNCFRWSVKTGDMAIGTPEIRQLPLVRPEGFASLCVASNDVVFTSDKGESAMVSQQPGDAPISSPAVWRPTSKGISVASPDGNFLAIYPAFSPRVHVYRRPGLVEIGCLTNRANVAGVAFSPRGGDLAVSTPKGVEVWSLSNLQRTRALTNFVSLLYSPDEKTVWLARDARRAGLYDAQSLELLLPLPAGTLPLAVSPDGRYLAASVDWRRVEVWDLRKVKDRLKELGLAW